MRWSEKNRRVGTICECFQYVCLQPLFPVYHIHNNYKFHYPEKQSESESNTSVTEETDTEIFEKNDFFP